MNGASESVACVRFVPSRVSGVSGVREVAFYSDRLELLGDAGAVCVRYEEVVPPAGPPTVFERIVRARPRRPPLLAVRFSPEKYSESFARLLADPPITIYMPSEGPTRFPDSAFARILRTTQAGGYGHYDVDDPRAKSERHRPLPFGMRTVLQAIAVVCVLNFVGYGVGAIVLGGTALTGRVENGRYFLNKPSKEREVSREVWVYSFWHATSALTGLAFMALAAMAAGAYAEHGERRAGNRGGALEPAAGAAPRIPVSRRDPA